MRKTPLFMLYAVYAVYAISSLKRWVGPPRRRLVRPPPAAPELQRPRAQANVDPLDRAGPGVLSGVPDRERGRGKA